MTRICTMLTVSMIPIICFHLLGIVLVGTRLEITFALVKYIDAALFICTFAFVAWLFHNEEGA